MSSRPFLCILSMYFYQHRCAKRISKPKIQTIFKFIYHCRFPKIFSIHFRYWRRYTFLSHLWAKSKISARWIKKLVAFTDGVYASKYIPPKPHPIYKHIFALCVPQTVASGYIPTPIFVYIKYIKLLTTVCFEKSNKFILRNRRYLRGIFDEKLLDEIF